VSAPSLPASLVENPRLDRWIRFQPDRTVRIATGKVEIGQGAVTAIGEQSLFVMAQGGQIEIFKLRYDGGKKLPAPQVCAEAGLSLGAILGG